MIYVTINIIVFVIGFKDYFYEEHLFDLIYLTVFTKKITFNTITTLPIP